MKKREGKEGGGKRNREKGGKEEQKEGRKLRKAGMKENRRKKQ